MQHVTYLQQANIGYILSKEYISWDLLERIYFIIIFLQVQGTLLVFIAVQDRDMNNLLEVTLFVL